MGVVLPFTGKLVRPITDCQHNWQPVPMEMACYECSKCKIIGRKSHGLIAPSESAKVGVKNSHKRAKEMEFLFGEIAKAKMQRSEERRHEIMNFYPDV